MAARPIRLVPVSTGYHFKQEVLMRQRESDETPRVEQAFQRSGIVTVAADVVNGRWVRAIRELESDPEFLRELRAEPAIDIQELQAEHDRLRRERTVEFGLESRLFVDSDLQNTEVAEPMGEERAPIPIDGCCLPALLPVLPEGGPQIGEQRSSGLDLRYGFGDFRVLYTARVDEIRWGNPTVSVNLDGQHHPSAEGEHVRLTLYPEGQWKVQLSADDGLPISSSGRVRLRVNAQVKQPLLEVDIYESQYHFEYERIPISFDDERIYPAAWHHQMENPAILPEAPG